jgi:hypothetical protein
VILESNFVACLYCIGNWKQQALCIGNAEAVKINAVLLRESCRDLIPGSTPTEEQCAQLSGAFVPLAELLGGARLRDSAAF